jgi:hypothetical protein
MKMKKTIYFAITILTLVGCNKDNPIDSGQPFQITIHSQAGVPVEGTTVEGGIDWDFYQVQTNAVGVATLPGSARGQRATIYKTNSLPIIVSSIVPSQYTLNETSKKLNLIGSVAGKAIRFRQHELITLDYGGTYHFYSYNDQSVSETFNRHLHDSAVAIRETQLFGDTLWFTTHNSGVFVFSIQNPSSPIFLFRLNVSGYLGPFAVKDSILVLGDQWNPGPLRLMVYYATGECRELSRVQNYFVRKMTRVGNAIISLGNSESLPTVFDISNPSSPRLVYNGLEWEYQTGFFYNRLTILTPRCGSGGNNIRLDYKVLDLSNPVNPTPMSPFTADSWITGVASDSWAFGNYYFHTQTISVLSGSISSSFQTVATVSENTIDGIGGAFPPYYLIGNRLWKLVDRQ